MLSQDQKDIGILGIEIYIPKRFVSQKELEVFDGVSPGKYTIGLGQENMAVVDDREDINSICLTVANLMEKYQIDPKDIGRLEVGTETIIDKSKSVKTILMSLFAGNTEIEGVDTTNACYGGTNALFNSINYLESSYCGDKLAICVAADIAVYKEGSARPTGGAGAVALLLGPKAPLVFEPGLRSTHMEHAYDFYKPNLHSEYPEVDGPLSNQCYTRAVDICYHRYIEKLSHFLNHKASLNNIDHFLFHSPYIKLVQKSFGRLKFNDFKRDPSSNEFNSINQKYLELCDKQSYVDRTLVETFVDLTKIDYASKTLPSLLVAKNIGNMYCASLYGGLCSLLSNPESKFVIGDRIAFFSYGSGLASSMFSLKVNGDCEYMCNALDISDRLSRRIKVEPQEYNQMMQMREDIHNQKDYIPKGKVEGMFFPGTFYLERIDANFRRTYCKA